MKTITAYHCGRRLVGDRFDPKYVGTGEGMTALGPGIYFADNRNIALMYCKYVDEPYLYTVKLDATGLYDPVWGEPPHLRDAVVDLVDSFDLDDPYRGVRRTVHGPASTGAVFKHLGPEGGRAALKDVGVTGIFERLPSDALEIAVYDPDIIEIVDIEQQPTRPRERALVFNPRKLKNRLMR